MTIGERIKASRKAVKLTQAAVAGRLGIDQSTLAHYERDQNRPSEERYDQLAKLFGVSTEWLQYGRGDAGSGTARAVSVRETRALGRHDQAVEFEGTRYLGVKYYDARVQAGPGGETTDEILDRYLFREASLRRITTAPLDQLGIVEVDGDSMEPTLRSGDQALVDLTQNRPTRKDGIYVLRSDDGLQVKRIAANPVTKKLTIKCDNERYPEYADVLPSKVMVLGRVVWIGRRI